MLFVGLRRDLGARKFAQRGLAVYLDCEEFETLPDRVRGWLILHGKDPEIDVDGVTLLDGNAMDFNILTDLPKLDGILDGLEKAKGASK